MKLLLALFLLTLNIAFVHANDVDQELNQAISGVIQGFAEVEQVGEIAGVDCGNLQYDIDRTVEQTYIEDINSREIGISSITPEYAEYLFTMVANMEEVPFMYPEDGCYARAHAMSRLLDGEGVESVKVFVEGDLRVETDNSPKGYVSWWYHVAPVVRVRDGENFVNMVFDPSIFDRPVPVEEWVAIQTNRDPARVDNLYYTERFNYTPNRTRDDYDDYQDRDLEDMNYTMQGYLEVQNNRITRRIQERNETINNRLNEEVDQRMDAIIESRLQDIRRDNEQRINEEMEADLRRMNENFEIENVRPNSR